MSNRVIDLGGNAELIIDEPVGLTSIDRGLAVTEAIVQVFSETKHLGPTTRYGSIVMKIGYSIYKVQYQLKVKSVLNSLEAYSQAIKHIESNPYLYDRRLAGKAIEVLRECYRNDLYGG